VTDCEHIEQTHALASGALAGDAADAARDHLADCEACQAAFHDALQLDAAVAEAPAAVVSLAWYRRRKIQLAGLAMAAAAGVILYLTLPRGGAPTDTAVIALAPKRGVEVRLAWGEAARYRPYDVPRGDAPSENVGVAVLGELDKRGDAHGVGVLALLDGDRRQAARYLERAGDTADVLADRAALALLDHDPSRALGFADAALAKRPGHPVALWNRALALRDLGRTADAAAAFREVADQGEPGWAAEAKQRAATLGP
jgi:hypothetical protein